MHPRGSNLKNRNEATDPSIGPNFPISVWSPSRLENCFLMLASSLPKKAKKRRGLILVMFESACKNRSILLFGCFLFFWWFHEIEKTYLLMKSMRFARRPPPQVVPPCTELPAEKAARDVRQETGATWEGVEFLRGVGSELEYSCSFEDAHGRK